MRRGLLAAAAAALSACSGTPGSGPGPTPPPPGGVAILAGAGDIAECSSPGAEATAQLLDRISGTVFTAGDNAYPHGSAAEFRDCYDPSWGRHKRRTRPSPGNHDYEQPGASGYYDYFAENAGPRGLGYYSYTVGSWRIYSLNSELSPSGMQLQAEWLQEELNLNPACSIAIWHKPLFTSGPNGPNPHMLPIWRILHSSNVDIVINGHDHLYERFAPQDPDGRPDGRGIRQFTVGTGGVPLYSFGATRPNSEIRASVWGVLVLILGDGSYEWNFMPAGIAGSSFRDTGNASCH
ncbi:MAG TPA: metallophosphoesterase [Vicinamibacterales bacterium]